MIYELIFLLGCAGLIFVLVRILRRTNKIEREANTRKYWIEFNVDQKAYRVVCKDGGTKKNSVLWSGKNIKDGEQLIDFITKFHVKQEALNINKSKEWVQFSDTVQLEIEQD